MDLLALVDAPDHVCCRYRIGAFAKALNTAGCRLTLEAFSRGLIGRLAQISRAARFDSVIVQRKLLPRWQLRLLRARTPRLVFDFDDAVLFRDSNDPRGPHCPRRAARFAEVVTLADVVIAGNDFLASCAICAGARAERVRVIPTCIDIDRYPPSTGAESRPGLDLVWIGSSSTLKGLERQRPVWRRIAHEMPGVRLRVICDRFPDFDPLPVVAVPWSEATEASALAAGDVGISWIPEDLWSRGKCGLKVLQYQASGLPVLANPFGVHPEMIADGVNGRLADTPDAWVEAVSSLAGDPARRHAMGEAARSQVAARYSVAAWSSPFVEAATGHGNSSSSRNHGNEGERPRPFSVALNPPHAARPAHGVGTKTGKVATS